MNTVKLMASTNAGSLLKTQNNQTTISWFQLDILLLVATTPGTDNVNGQLLYPPFCQANINRSTLFTKLTVHLYCMQNEGKINILYNTVPIKLCPDIGVCLRVASSQGFS